MNIFITNEAELEFPEGLFESVVKKTLEYEHIDNDFEVSITLTDEETVHLLNKKYRGIDSTTDVLSFPFNDFSQTEIKKDEYLVLGDIVINVKRAAEQAEQYGHSLKRELAFLTAHSMLHLLGYDHMEKSEEEIMFKKQEEILELMEIRR